MGAGPWSLLTVLFRVIPRFPPEQGVRECATPTSPGVCGHREHEDAATHAIEHRPGVCGQRQSQPATVRPDSYDPNLENHHTGDHHTPDTRLVSDVLTPQSRRRTGPISSRK